MRAPMSVLLQYFPVLLVDLIDLFTRGLFHLSRNGSRPFPLTRQLLFLGGQVVASGVESAPVTTEKADGSGNDDDDEQ